MVIKDLEKKKVGLKKGRNQKRRGKITPKKKLFMNLFRKSFRREKKKGKRGVFYKNPL